MIATMSLAEEIASEVAQLREAYPKGATMHDLAGWFGQPSQRIEDAIASMRADGADLSFLRQEPAKNPAAVLMGQAGGRARAEKVDAERRAAIAREAAAARWESKAPQQEYVRGPYTKRDPDEPSPKQLREKLIQIIPRLAKEYPNGMVIDQLFFELNGSETRIRALVATAQREGWCDHIKERTEANGKRQIYLFDGMQKRAPQLTIRQGEVWRWLLAHATDGEVTAKMNAICRDMNIADGTVFGHLYALESKGYIERLTGYNDRVNGIRVSPRFKMLGEAKPELVKLKPPPAKAIQAPAETVQPSASYLYGLRRRRSELARELQAVDDLLSLYE